MENTFRPTLETSHNRLLMWFYKTFPEIVKTMDECSHHFDDEHINGYHTEGRILCHSLMVFKNSQIFSPENNHLKYAALFHDLGKPIAMDVKPEKKKKNFSGHEGLSAFMAVDILNETDISETDKLHIFKIVALHGSLFNYIRADGTIKDDLREVYEGNSALLRDVVVQVRNDSFGRFVNEDVVTDHCPEFTKNLPTHFEETVNSLGDDVYRGDKPHQLTLLVGAPCSEKSSHIATLLEADPNLVVISRDALVEAVGAKHGMENYSDSWKWLKQNEKVEKLEVDAELIKQVQTARREKKNVCVDMTMMSKKSRKKFINQFEKDYNKKCILFIKGYEEQLKCNVEREKRTGKRINKFVTLNMLKGFALPMYGEGFDEIEWKWMPKRF